MDYSKLSDQELVDLYQQEMQKRSGKGAPAEKGGEGGGPLTGSHYGDLITRVLAKGALSLPEMVSRGAMDLPIAKPGMIALHAMGVDTPPLGDIVNKGMDRVGLEKPQTTGERLAVDTGTGAVGALTTLPLGGSGTLATATSGAGGGLASGVAREAGLPDWLQAIAGMLGGLAHPAGKAVGKVAYNAVEPHLPGGVEAVKSRTLGNAVGDRLDAVKDALVNAPGEIVPGSVPTAAQKAVPAGSTELSALEALLARKYDPSGYRDIAKAGEGARDTWAAYPNTPEGQAVPADLARTIENQKMAAQGGTRAASLVAETMDPVGQIPNALSRPLMIARYLAQRAKGMATEKTLVPLTEDLKDPKKVLDLLQNVPPTQGGQTLAALKAAIMGILGGQAGAQ